jgi:hypothetical protein
VKPLKDGLILLLGAKTYGALRYRGSPTSGRAWGGPMNGQGGRVRLVAELLLKTEPVAIVETGTYRGTTTEWLAAFQLPVYTCEASGLNFGFSRARLGVVPNVHMLHLDSRSALRHLLTGPLSAQLDKPILFYLDAHGSQDLPLAEEIDIIFPVASRAIVLIDDFQVPDDPGYAYDDYGPGKLLTPDYIAEGVARHSLQCFYPRTPAERETGTRRGCVVLAQHADIIATLEGVANLRRLSDLAKG